MWQQVSLGLFAVAISATVVHASDPAISAIYGNGVHAYYSRGYQQSFDSLSQVVEIGTNDPRVYYFRGLAALKLGRRDKALADFSKGADLETNGWGMRTVSRSLERVQGADRLLLEQSRQASRLAIAQQKSVNEGGYSLAPKLLGGPRYSGIGGQKREKPAPGPGPATIKERAVAPSQAETPPYGSDQGPVTNTVPADEGLPKTPQPTTEMQSEKNSDRKDPFGLDKDPFTDEPDKATSSDMSAEDKTENKTENKTEDKTEDKKPITPRPSDDDPFNFTR